MVSSVLLIEEDPEAVQAVRGFLAAAGYQVQPVRPGPEALRGLGEHRPDLVILGVKPQSGDWQFLERLLLVIECPVFVTLARRNDAACARALELGADECMAYPLNDVEFLARVRAVLRRNGGRDPLRERCFYVDGDLLVDLTRREVRLDDRPVAMTPIEMRLLACLVRNEGQALSAERLIAQVWGTADGASRECVRQHMYRLRQKLGPGPGGPGRIVARRGEGYRLRRVRGSGPVGPAALRDAPEVCTEASPPTADARRHGV